jgi:hypothetical protein
MSDLRGQDMTSGEAAVDKQGAASMECQYELFSIMMHTGSATAGHYFAYIKVRCSRRLVAQLRMLWLHVCALL